MFLPTICQHYEVFQSKDCALESVGEKRFGRVMAEAHITKDILTRGKLTNLVNINFM